jgi:hypothetical protein
MKQALFYTVIVFLIVLSACKKDTFITGKDARVLLSADTLRFDTVFTTAGSVTQLFKITNGNNQKIKIDNVSLKGGGASAFKINVDGITGPEVKNLELDANDSIFVFVTVTINASPASRPFIIRDSIGIECNGNKQFLQLEAWGQNAHFLRNRKITGTTVWTNDLPYVILGGLQVDTSATLTIQKGCKIYLHADAPLLVDGTLQVNGEKSDSDRVYCEYPAGWPGIYLRATSKSNVLQYAVIRNAYQGLVVQEPAANASPKLILNECIIDNIYDVGLYGIGSSVSARNCLISNCGKNVQLVYGGNYQFTHCSMPTIGNSYISHKDPVLYVSNYVQAGGVVYTDNLSAVFTNCIIWAENSTASNEVVVTKQGAGSFNVSFTNCLWKVKTAPLNTTATGIISNLDPVFDSINVAKGYYNFRLRDSSPALNKGLVTGLPTDLDGNPRAVGQPDLGAYEKQ